MPEITESKNGLVFGIKVTPNAGRTGITGEHAGCIKIKVNAQPEKGKANKEIVVFLSRILGIKKSQVEIISGETSRDKRVRVSGIEKQQLISRLLI